MTESFSFPHSSNQPTYRRSSLRFSFGCFGGKLLFHAPDTVGPTSSQHGRRDWLHGGKGLYLVSVFAYVLFSKVGRSRDSLLFGAGLYPNTQMFFWYFGSVRRFGDLATAQRERKRYESARTDGPVASEAVRCSVTPLGPRRSQSDPTTQRPSPDVAEGRGGKCGEFSCDLPKTLL